MNQMAARIKTVRQLHTLLFLFFGACTANEVFAGLRAIQYSSMSLSILGIDVFEPFVAYAFVVFMILSVLHALQWTLDYRLQSAIAETDRDSRN